MLKRTWMKLAVMLLTILMQPQVCAAAPNTHLGVPVSDLAVAHSSFKDTKGNEWTPLDIKILEGKVFVVTDVAWTGDVSLVRPADESHTNDGRYVQLVISVNNDRKFVSNGVRLHALYSITKYPNQMIPTGEHTSLTGGFAIRPGDSVQIHVGNLYNVAGTTKPGDLILGKAILNGYFISEQ